MDIARSPHACLLYRKHSLIGTTLLAALLLLAAALPRQIHGQEFSSEMIATELREGGEPVRLELVFRKPAGEGPFPTVIFNHGSTGHGDKPELFRQTWSHLPVAKYFNDQGWMIVFPQRRGRGESEGTYDEGFELDRSQYSCIPELSLAGVDRAIADLDAVVAHLKSRSDVRADRLLIAGHSRGGILAIAYAGVRPEVFVGAVNFVGGWMTDRCPDPVSINTVTFRRGAAFKRGTLWLYGKSDPFYSLAHSKSNFEAFKAAGGSGKFYALSVPGKDSGHDVLWYPEVWQKHLGKYLSNIK